MAKGNVATESKRPYDFYRDSLIRVLGYAGFIGGALRPFVPHPVLGVSRAVATTYICQDIIDKASKESTDPKRLTIAAGDATVWQLLSSVIVPGIILNGVNNMRCKLVSRQSYTVRRLSHTVVGLMAIAVIIRPVDAIVDIIMDETYRKWTKDTPNIDKKGKPLKNKT